MKKIVTAIIYFVFLVSNHAGFAQTVKWSAPMTDDRKFPYLNILGETDDGYYLLRSNLTFSNDKNRSGFRSRKYLLQLFDDDLRTRFSRPIDLGLKESGICDVGIVGNHVAVLYSIFDKQEKQLKLYVQKLDGAGNISDPAVLVLETGADKVDDDNKPDFIFSHSKNLVACALRSVSIENGQQRYSISIFDTSLHVIAKKEIDVPVKAKLFGPISSVLSDAGNFYLLGIEFTSEKRVKNPGESFYKLISYQPEKDLVAQNAIRLENKFLTDVAISADNMNHRIVVSGFYSLNTTYSTAGIFYYSLSEDSLLPTPVVASTFTQEFLRKLATEGRMKNNELVNYSIDRSIIRKDAGAAIVAESFNITTRSYWDYYLQMWVDHYYYHYGNIIALSINPDGSILWSNNIQKDQNSTDDGGYYSSYFSAIINGKIMCIYNKYISDQSSVLITTISGVGEQQTNTLFEESLNTAVIPHSAKQVDEETVLMPVERDGEPFLLKITF
ncbi:MAG: hypothetical protein ABI763_00745 [Bacteroidota bacterium]